LNTPLDHEANELRHAEYALGVLDAASRAAVEQEMRDDPRATAAVALWQRHLAPLGQDIEAIQPPAHVWIRIQSDLGLHATPPVSRIRLWDNLPLWRWVGIGATLAAAACLVILLTMPRQAPPPAVGAGYMVSSIAQDNGVTGWTATKDLQHAHMLIVPATPIALASGQAPELWLIPPHAKPISLGMIALDRPTSVTLRPELLARLGAQAVLAVSAEPPGGSPTGQPTGPVIAKGTIRGT